MVAISIQPDPATAAAATCVTLQVDCTSEQSVKACSRNLEKKMTNETTVLDRRLGTDFIRLINESGD